MPTKNDYLTSLNGPQKDAVTHSEGPMLVLAGAGSGKTRTITHKIAYLIDHDICQPEKILAVTFTNKAAGEMRSRVEDLLSDRLTAAPLVCTFHSFGVRVLRRYGDRLGYRRDFTICDREDQIRSLKVIYKQLQFTDREIPVNKALAAISRAKNMEWNAEAYRTQATDHDREEIARIFNGYQDLLKQSNAVDFDDLILLTVHLLREHADLRLQYGQWYRYILIDEYQDTNRPQYNLVKNLTEVHQNLTAVGDEDQSIYAFRGADIGNILRFEADFPGATIVRLEQNYRSSGIILEAATAVVSNNTHRKGKTLWTERAAGDLLELFAAPDARTEAAYVSQKIYEHLHRGERGLAILYRTNFQSRLFEEALRQLDVSYQVVGGVSFYHRREIKDALAYLRVAVNPEDSVSLLRVINRPPRGIGQLTLDQLQQMANRQNSSLWSALERGLEEKAFSGRAHLALQRLLEIVQKCQLLLELPLHLCIERMLEETGYLAALRSQDTEEAQSRILNLEELINSARESLQSGNSLQEFLDQAALRSEIDDLQDSAMVSLMTLHNAKGLEFSTVFLAGCEEGLFPHSRSVAEDELEEERRLCYVGLTRGQRKIYLTYSRRRRFYGQEAEEMNRPSRFLEEIPEHLLLNHPERPAPFSPDLRAPDRPWSPPRARTSANPPPRTYDSPARVREFLASRTSTKSSVGGLVSGARILHSQFGFGKILHVQNTGDDLKITVSFSEVGIKKVLQSYAKLKLV